MKPKAIFLFLFVLLTTRPIFGQTSPEINIKFSKLLATYDFVQKLSDDYPDNKLKEVFKSSKFNSPHYKDLVTELDTTNIYESYSFQGYPAGQKARVTTTSLIKRNLISASSIQEFKKETFGIIPNSSLLRFSKIISEFETVYDSLVYIPNKVEFEQQLKKLKDFVQNSNLAGLFEKGLIFYNSNWDYSIPIEIALIPSIENGGFSAAAFLNNAIIEVPLNFKRNDILFSVLMHEIYHTIYDEQSLEFKRTIEDWFKEHPSENSQYAYLLLNECLATALGNGYVYEQLNGKSDDEDWYNVKYINLMAKQVYPDVKEYLSSKKPMDKKFVNKYIASYDEHFHAWSKELENLMTNRYILTEDPEDFGYFRKVYPYTSNYQSETPVSENGLGRMKQVPFTKIIIISTDHKNKLPLIKNTFPELRNWKYHANKEFAFTTKLEDRTRLIIINKLTSSLEEIFEKNFKDKRIQEKNWRK